MFDILPSDPMRSMLTSSWLKSLENDFSSGEICSQQRNLHRRCIHWNWNLGPRSISNQFRFENRAHQCRTRLESHFQRNFLDNSTIHHWISRKCRQYEENCHLYISNLFYQGRNCYGIRWIEYLLRDSCYQSERNIVLVHETRFDFWDKFGHDVENLPVRGFLFGLIRDSVLFTICQWNW